MASSYAESPTSTRSRTPLGSLVHFWDSLPLLAFGAVLTALGFVLLQANAQTLAFVFFSGALAVFAAPLVIKGGLA